MIIQIGNIKGGCGKSTLTTNLAALLAVQGKDVIIVDADRQATSSNWALDRQELDLPKVHHVQAFDNIRDTVRDLDKRYEIVIVDAGGRDSRELRTGILAADILIVPFRPSQPDLDVLPSLQEILQLSFDMNPKLKAFAVLSLASTNPSVKEIDEAVEYLKDYPEIKLLSSLVYDRKIYRDAISEGRGVVEMDNLKAKFEITTLMEEIYGYTS